MLANPFFIYIISFASALLLSLLGWSDLYKPLNIMVVVFFIFTFILSLFIGIFVQNKNKPEFIRISDQYKVKNKVKFLFLLLFFQIILDPQVPLLNVIMYSYSGHGNYGFPILHPFILTYSSFVSVYIFHLFVSEKKKKLLIFFLMSNVPPLIFYSRGTFMITLIACVFVLLIFYKEKWNARKIITLLIILMVIMYIFGILGDARTGGSSAGILYSGGATEKFRENIIPDEFFWSYVYITSPLANFNYNVVQRNISDRIKTDEILTFVIGDFVPDVLSNRILSTLNLKITPGSILQVHGNLTVTTMYTRPFYILGWLGPLLTYIYMVIFILVFLKILKKNNPYYVTGICFLNTMVGLNFFSNMLGQTSVFAPLAYAVILGSFSKIKIKLR